jgi:hypothetical protein
MYDIIDRISDGRKFGICADFAVACSKLSVIEQPFSNLGRTLGWNRLDI